MAGKKINTTSMTDEVNVTNDDIQDIDLKVTAKKKFRFNGDNSKILELNTSDLTIASRLQSSLTRLNELTDKAGKIAIDANAEDKDSIEMMIQSLDEVDAEMREIIDYIFDSNVSEVCASDGSMYDPFEGTFRYEYILNKLTTVYENNINSEYRKMQNRINKHTSKYVK